MDFPEGRYVKAPGDSNNPLEPFLFFYASAWSI